MLTFLSGFLRTFMAVAFLVGVMVTFWHSSSTDRKMVPMFWASLIGILAGSALYWVGYHQDIMFETNTILYAVWGGSSLWGALGTCVYSRSRSRAMRTFGWVGTLVFLASLGAFGVYSFIPFAWDQAISLTSVLNTEMVLNVGAILIGISLITVLAPVVQHIFSKQSMGYAIGTIFFLCALYILRSSAEVMLAMMQMEYMEITSLALSFVAKVVGFQYLVDYAIIVIFALVTFIFFLKRPKASTEELAGLTSPNRRKKMLHILTELRWARSAGLLCVFLLGPLMYYDLYASQPPRISTPTPVVPNEDGLLKFPIEAMKDGKLHRFSYVTSDGTVVRFFIINRYQDSVKLTAVYDSCLVCGDMGYNQEGNDVICLACNVRMFVPSIGKPGGCNPIPFEFEMTDTDLVIREEVLDEGAQYFSEVAEVTVKDPVNGEETVNVKAPYRYSYKGRTYFFTTEESYDAFKVAPEKYVGEVKARRSRVEGYPEL